MGYGLVVLRVEGLAFRVDAFKAFPGKDFEQRTCNLLHVRATTMGNGQVGRVQDRQQLFHEGGSGIFDDLSLLAVNAFAVVVKFGLEAEQGLEVLVALARQFSLRGQRVLTAALAVICLVRRAVHVLAALTRHA
jgi:hypothetical protein